MSPRRKGPAMPGNVSGTILEAVNDLVANSKAADSDLLASGVRFGTTATADQVSTGADALYLILDVTAVPGVSTLQLVVEMKDPASGKYIVLGQTTASAAVGTFVLLLAAGAAAAANGVSTVAGFPPPPTWRARVVHAGAGNF